MTLGVRIWVAWAALLAVGVNGQSNGAFWWLENSTSAPASASPLPSTAEIRCQCVPYYLCVDGVITTSGVGLIDIRSGVRNASQPVYNVENCPELIDVCCKLPDGADSGPTTTPVPTTTTTLPPDTPCDCVPLLDCKDPNRLVSDGKGNTSLALFGSSFSHSKCQGAFTVCCASESTAQPLEDNECVCVAQNLCGTDGHVITDGEGLINIRFGAGGSATRPGASGRCPNSGDVCCLLPPDVTTPKPTTTSTAAPLPDCGWRNVGGVRVRVLGFKEGESQFGEYPWVAAILKPIPGAATPMMQFVGGGTLIHPRVVLTAAHKVFRESKDQLVVRLGEWDTQGETEPYLHQDAKVSHVIIHKDFNPSTLYYDAALLFLEEEVVLGSHINTICLAEDLTHVDWSGCVINGWGVNAFGTTQYQEIMKSLELPLVDSSTCQNRLRTTRLGSLFNLHPTFVCAGGEAGKDACKGDGGGPLACPRLSQPSGHYLLVGLTAWGVGCGREGLPGVYVNIPQMQPWITTTMEEYLTSPGQHGNLQVERNGGEEVTTAAGGAETELEAEVGAGGGREEKRRRNQERREQRQREREERRRQREERREQRRQNRQQNRNGRK